MYACTLAHISNPYLTLRIFSIIPRTRIYSHLAVSLRSKLNYISENPFFKQMKFCCTILLGTMRVGRRNSFFP